MTLLDVKSLSKTFPGLKALDEVSLSVDSSEIVALVGQNGSGKSTLVKVLAGIHEADPGAEIHLAKGDGADGAQTELHFIHQDLGLVEMLSTVENLDLGHRLGRRDLMPAPVRHERERAESLIAGFGASFDVLMPVAELSAAERAIVAVARALDRWNHSLNVLILDEPTAALHGEEVDKLFEAIRRVAARGAGVVFISHRLDEVHEIADRVVVLRDGHLVGDARRGTFDDDKLVQMITGGALPPDAARVDSEQSNSVLMARGLRCATISDLDIDIHRGEILGISGVLGSGRDQVAATLFGVASGEAREVHVAGEKMSGLNPRIAIRAGVAYLPGDRHRQGAVMTMSAGENLTLPRLSPLRRASGRLDRRRERADVNSWMEAVAVRPAEPERELNLFSGGNQQKVVLAKWLRNEPKVLLLDEPTQGVDVGAKGAILDLITAAAGRGAGVLISSSDTKELAVICDRVLVMREGRVVAEVKRGDLSEARLVREGLGRPNGSGDAEQTGEEGQDG
jgi:ABC-type sugar transport system ATPase subunit